jgi:lipid-binding SYLF domain-containing protein
MYKRIFYLFLAGSILAQVSGCGPGADLSLAERKQFIVTMEKETLQRLYREHPSARYKIRKAAGYGVFSNSNVNIIFASAGGGYGTVIDNETKKRTYMKMALGGVGFGLGVKDYRQVLIFKSGNTLRRFIVSGWDVGAHADSTAKVGRSGKEARSEGAIRSNIEVYTMTESGLVLQASVTGTRYWKDEDLN